MVRTKVNFYNIYNMYYKNLFYTNLQKPIIFINTKYFYPLIGEGYFYFDIIDKFYANILVLFKPYRYYFFQKRKLDYYIWIRFKKPNIVIFNCTKIVLSYYFTPKLLNMVKY